MTRPLVSAPHTHKVGDTGAPRARILTRPRSTNAPRNPKNPVDRVPCSLLRLERVKWSSGTGPAENFWARKGGPVIRNVPSSRLPRAPRSEEHTSELQSRRDL